MDGAALLELITSEFEVGTQGIEETQVRFLQGLLPGAEATRIRYTNLKGEKWEYSLEQMVHHLAMHTAFHRGQMATILRQMALPH